MKRRIWLLSLLLVILAGLITGVACLAWLVCTTQGTRIIVGGVSRLSGFTGMRLEVEKVAGNLRHEVLLEGISLRLPDAAVHVGSARFKCELFYLLAGKLAVQEVSVRDVSIRDKRPDIEKPLDLTWPRVPFWLGRLEGWINQLGLSELSYQRLDGEPVRVDHVNAHLFWYQGVLHVSGVDVGSALGRVEGNLAAGLVRPSFDADLSITPANRSGLSHISLGAHLAPALYPKELSGSISLTVKPPTRGVISAASRLALARQSIELSKIEVSEKGRRGNIDAEVGIDFSSSLPRVRLSARLSDVDLSAELKTRALVSGTVNISGSSQSYAGRFSLESKGEFLRSASLSGDVEGNLSEARLRLRKGSVLGASVTADVYVERGERLSVRGNVHCRNFNPASLLPTWEGEINLDVDGNVRIIDGRLEGTVAAAFPGSRLRGLPLTGNLEVRFQKGMVSIPDFAVHGRGFDLRARGALNERIAYDAQVGDLSALFQEAGGRVSANGWVRFAKGAVSGILQGKGSQISFRDTSLGELYVTLKAEQGTKGPTEGRVSIKKAKHDLMAVDSASLDLRGSAQDHVVWCDVRWHGGEASALARGSYRDRVWQATLTKLDGRDRVSLWRLAGNSRLFVSEQRIAVSRMLLNGTAGEHLDLSADLSFSPRKGFVSADWKELNLARLRGLLGKASVSGNTTGSFRAELPDNGNPALSGSVSAAGKFSYGSVDVAITKANASLGWDQKGLRTSWEITSTDGARITGRAFAAEPPRASLPDRASIEMAWDGMELATLRAWLKPPADLAPTAGSRPASTKRIDVKQPPLSAGFDLQGRLSGNLSGELLPGGRVSMSGETSLARGVAAWRGAQGLVRATVEQAKLVYTWKGGNLSGNATLALSGYGRLEASFQLPITARIPPVIEQDGPIRISLTGDVRERGFLTAFFPGLIQESSGRIKLDLGGSGTWSRPVLNGHIRLTQAGAYLPSAGVLLKDVEADAEFVEDQIRLTSFTLHSGQGQLHGKATFWLKDWQIARYEGSLQGERFQTVYLPELQVLTDPDLTFEGTTQKAVVRGAIQVPDFLLRQPETRNLIRPSSDVVIVGEPAKQAHTASFALDAEIKVILGDRVKVQAMGIDAQLGGSLTLSATSIDNVTATGEIRVTKGAYQSAGVKLDITRGRIIFSGGPPDKAALDIVAMRRIEQTTTPGKLGTPEEVLAGVNVGGTISSPVVKLYSVPAMTDPEILSYIVFGKPLSPGTDQSALLSQAASTLLAASPSSGIEQRLKDELGISVGIAPSSSTTVGASNTPGSSSSSFTSSLVTVGKYLSPQLYVSLGHSVFTGENLITARYRLSKHWEVESKSGTQVGADLFYRIEFD